MRIAIAFTDSEARSAHYYLKRRYQSRASFEKLAKTAIRELVAEQARAETEEAKMLEDATKVEEQQ